MLLAYSIIAMWILLSLSALLGGATWIARTRETATLLTCVAAICLGLALASTAFWTWVLRDGLGADSIRSNGLLALRHFWNGFWIPLVIATLGGCVILVSWRARLRAIERDKTT
jgi:hypothetical protein